MKADWWKLGLLALLSLGSYVALSTDDQRLETEEPSANPTIDESETTQPPANEPAKPPANEPARPAGADAGGKEPLDNRTPEERADPDGGFEKAPVSDKPEELPPDLRETADFDISFPVDI